MPTLCSALQILVVFVAALSLVTSQVPSLAWTDDGEIPGYYCTSFAVERQYWDDNFLCSSDVDIRGWRWSNVTMGGYNCHDFSRPSIPGWGTKYLCISGGLGVTFKYRLTTSGIDSGALVGTVNGEQCINIYERGDNPSMWEGTHLCVSYATAYPGTSISNNFADYLNVPTLIWSYAGPVDGLSCILVDEPSTPQYTWSDNYLCSPSLPIGNTWAWSTAGRVPNMHCVAWFEPMAPSWMDNYLCMPYDSKYAYVFSNNGKVPGAKCTQILEPADPNSWNDNYFCVINANNAPRTVADYDMSAITYPAGNGRNKISVFFVKERGLYYYDEVLNTGTTATTAITRVVPFARPAGDISTVYFQGNLYVFYRDFFKGIIMYVTHNGIKWSPERELTDAYSTNGPSAVVYATGIMVFYRYQRPSPTVPGANNAMVMGTRLTGPNDSGTGSFVLYEAQFSSPLAPASAPSCVTYTGLDSIPYVACALTPVNNRIAVLHFVPICAPHCIFIYRNSPYWIEYVESPPATNRVAMAVVKDRIFMTFREAANGGLLYTSYGVTTASTSQRVWAPVAASSVGVNGAQTILTSRVGAWYVILVLYANQAAGVGLSAVSWRIHEAATTPYYEYVVGTFKDLTPVSSTRVRLIVTADPQYPWCDDKDLGGTNMGPNYNQPLAGLSGCTEATPDSGNNSPRAKYSDKLIVSQYHSVRQLVSTIREYLGQSENNVLINGDITAFGHPWQKQKYQDSYYPILNTATRWPGLGNHDIFNPLDADQGCSRASNCAGDMLRWEYDRVRESGGLDFDAQATSSRIPGFYQTLKGSFAYYYKIGNYRIIQLQYTPVYNRRWRGLLDGSIDLEFESRSAVSWLADKLSTFSSSNNKCILNVHDYSFNTADPVWAPFHSLIAQHSRIICGIFTGHVHQSWGYDGRGGSSNRTVGIPIFRVGSATFSRYSIVELDPSQNTMTVAGVINERHGSGSGHRYYDVNLSNYPQWYSADKYGFNTFKC